jgi:CHRD domain
MNMPGAQRFWRTGMAFAVLAVAGCGVSNSQRPGVITTTSRQTSETPPCRSDPQQGVHESYRLKILDPCTTFVGKVAEAPHLNPSDGDVTFSAAPDPGYASMLNDKNRSKDGFHIEIVPRDQPGCKRGEAIIFGSVENLGLCSGAHVLYPPLGAHFRVIGPYVYDRWVGWNEIHPAWKVEILPPTGPPPPEAHQFEARLTGKAAVKKGAAHGFGRVTVTVTGGKVCWRFSRLAGIGRPKRATIRAGGPLWIGPILMTLGPRYRARGCATPDAGRLNSLMQRPRAYYVTVVTARYRLGAIRGQLTPTSD